MRTALHGPPRGPPRGSGLDQHGRGVPSSYSYFMQVQPHHRGGAFHEHKTVRFMSYLPSGHEQRLSIGAAESPFHRLVHDAAADHIRQEQERAPFSSSTFQGSPLRPIKVPSTFTHGNPLSSQRPGQAALDASLEDGDFHSVHDGFASSGRGLQRAPAGHGGGSRQRKARPSRTQEVGVLGDPQRPNLGIIGVPGNVEAPPPPRVREYDPYTGKFKAVTTDEVHDSREQYTRPGAEQGGDQEVGAGPGVHNHEPEEVREESYEVHEMPVESPPVVTVHHSRTKANNCQKKDFLSSLLSPLLSPVRNKCQKQHSPAPQPSPSSQREHGDDHRYEQLHRPRGRPPHRRKKIKQHKQRPSGKLQREPYFEFRNPVNSFVSGRKLADQDINRESREHLMVGDAEREARDDTDTQQRFPEDDDDTFAPYSVYHSVLEPDKKFRPFVRFPFEAERSNLKAMVNDLIQG